MKSIDIYWNTGQQNVGMQLNENYCLLIENLLKSIESLDPMQVKRVWQWWLVGGHRVGAR